MSPKPNIFNVEAGEQGQVFILRVEHQGVSSFPNVPSHGSGNSSNFKTCADREEKISKREGIPVGEVKPEEAPNIMSVMAR
jgi:hypothetical protein